MADEVWTPPPQPTYYPTRWATWSAAVRGGAQPSSLGLKCANAALNRFAARYRAARSFDGVRFRAYSVEVADGYSASTELFLAYGAFEAFCGALSCKPYDAVSWLNPYVKRDLDQDIRALDQGARIFTAVQPHLNATLRPIVGDYLAGERVPFLVLAAALRHMFVHGMLTPSVNGALPANFAAICRVLSAELLEGVDKAFASRVDKIRPRAPNDAW